ncbi:zinc finger protein RFP-like [Eublepharis macularius]|uniref:Zinc finger protein RFP-like n=1 Tax=Eublepharis macularius TaxID=481883 RepID=A0AA97KKR3_EUBMA|nr:zinc finger protein RFP-like [Eublepharis macularius]
MADECPKMRLRQEVTCSVCLEYFTDPYTVDCGHNFCRSCIAQCLAESPTEVACPQCRVQIQPQNFKQNRYMANFVEISKQLSGHKERNPRRKNICERHQESLNFFCRNDQVRICLVCDKSEEHEGHDTIPVEMAAQEFKVGMRSSRTCEITFYLCACLKMEEGKDKITTAFLVLREFLVDGEILVSNQLGKVEKEIARKLEEHMSRAAEKLSSFDHIFGKMEEMCRLPEDELLQKAGSNLQRWAREKFEKPVAYSAALKWKLWEICDIHNFLEVSVNRVRALFDVGFQLQYQKAIVTFDPATAHPKLVLSEDCKTVRWDNQDRAVPDIPGRFDLHPCVLGCEGFNLGRLYWDVDVGVEGDWAVGVAKESVERKGEIVLSSEKGIFAIGKCGDRYWAFEELNVAFPWKPLKPMTIRVALDYIGAGVGFSDADTAAELFEFREDSFTDERLYPFFWLQKGAQLKIHS